FSHEATTRPSATSAMVLIKYTPLTPTTDNRPRPAGAGFADAPVTADDVKHMVAKSVEGLSPENVFVTFTRASVTPPAPPPVTPAVAAANTKTDSSDPPPPTPPHQ